MDVMMKLRATNIGRFDKIELELNGLTVIAGVNSCGKTTLGKALYAATKCETYLLENILQKKMEVVENTLSNFELLRMIGRHDEEKIIDSKKDIEKVDSILKRYSRREKFSSLDFPLLVDEVVSILRNESIRNMLNRVGRLSSKNSYDEIISILNSPINYDNSEINRKLVEYVFHSEFSDQLSNFKKTNLESTISFEHEEEISNFIFQNGKCTSCIINKPYFQSITYLDDVYALDNLQHPPVQKNRQILYTRNIIAQENAGVCSFNNDHRKDLISQLFAISKPEYRTIAEDISLDKITINLVPILNKLISGQISYSKENRDYVYSENNENVFLKNTASGVKAIGLIDLLLRNGYIHGNSCLIIDEPETHLHPEWQIKLAELLVCLVKETSIRILLNTHSPYFLEAIRTYSKLHKTLEKTKFYYIKPTDEYNSNLVDVSDDISPVFKVLAEPYRILDKVFNETL